jgi:pilus assembly protein CpaE
LPSTVLLFSPDAAVREEVRAALAAAGYDVTATGEGAEAREKAGEHQLLVVDVTTMQSGTAEFTRVIRREAGLSEMPILAVADTDDIEERIALIEAGADEVIARPFDPRELEGRMLALELRLPRAAGDMAAPPPTDALREAEAPEHRLIAVFGPKGGTGTTTIAVNVALALANQRPDGVALIDLDAQFGQVATYLLPNVPKRTLAEIVQDDQALDDAETLRSYASRVEPGLHIYPAASSPALAELATQPKVERLLKTARESYEILVIDAGSHLDDRALGVLESADVVIVPVRPEMAALRAVVGLTGYLRDINALGPGTLFVVNHLVPREMVKLRDIESLLGARVAVEIPPDPYVFLKAVNEGVPVVRAAPKSVAAQRLARLAAMTLGESRIVESRAPQKKPGRRLLSLRGSR